MASSPSRSYVLQHTPTRPNAGSSHVTSTRPNAGSSHVSQHGHSRGLRAGHGTASWPPHRHDHTYCNTHQQDPMPAVATSHQQDPTLHGLLTVTIIRTDMHHSSNNKRFTIELALLRSVADLFRTSCTTNPPYPDVRSLSINSTLYRIHESVWKNN